MKTTPKMLLAPDPHAEGLSTPVTGTNEAGEEVAINVITERPLTLFLNSQEVVTMMTIGDHPELLGLGYLINQNMLKADDPIEAIDYDDELGVVVVRTVCWKRLWRLYQDPLLATILFSVAKSRTSPS